MSQDLNAEFHDSRPNVADNVNIKILNAGAWARGSERVAVTLPTELEDYIPELEEFYKAKHSGRKLQWHHHMSNGTVTFTSKLVRRRRGRQGRQGAENEGSEGVEREGRKGKMVDCAKRRLGRVKLIVGTISSDFASSQAGIYYHLPLTGHQHKLLHLAD